jgi:hypothetical protein
MQKACSLIAFLLLVLTVFGQDSAAVKKELFVPIGIYYTSKSFFNKKTDFERPFRVVANYRYRFIGDSVVYGNTFQVLDSTIISGFVFGFYDGVDMYINVEAQIRKDQAFMSKGLIRGLVDLADLGNNNGGFFKIEKLGRHPYVLVERGFTMPILIISPLSAAAGILTSVGVNSLLAAKAAANINKMDVYYFSLKDKLRRATPEGIGFLLKNEKDLYEAYSNEPHITTEVIVKYLNKLNDRYPDL